MRAEIAGLWLVVAVCASASDTVAPLGKYTPVERRHWAFQPRSKPAIPRFADAAGRTWVVTPVDAFILDRLRKEQLRPSPAASRAVLIRRVTFDLTGLPPTPREIDAFVADRSPDAYEKVVDRLLASPHYGERWGQHWLDVVRFAETDGFEYDTHRRDAWRYRDYVIRAFNNDKPYDRFLTEQLAGDEIAPKEDETLVATAFNRLGPLRKNAGNQEVASSRNEVLTEMTNIVGSALLGMTLGCARCHDHKFDPIRQSDYYRMQAYFAATWEKDVDRATPEERMLYQAKLAPIEAEMKRVKSAMRGTKDAERAALEKQLEELESKKPESPPALYSVADDMSKRTGIHLLARGEWEKKGERVGARPPGVLLPDNEPERDPTAPMPRAELAKWVTDPANPLTARVMVNRIWHFHFGRGIVGSPNDFGRMGERPSHPELLDWLANQFFESGWSVKRIHKLILMSNAYRQSSSAPASAAALEKDPQNRLLWHFTRRRLEAEEIRDAMLAVSGSINPKAGGASVMVPIDQALVAALYKPSQWQVAQDPAEHNRRSVYLLAKRNLRLPFMEVFDQPDSQVSCPKRESSTHAPQALEMLNGDIATSQSEAFAGRLRREAGEDPARQAELAWRLATGRLPMPVERKMAIEFLKTQPAREFALAVFNLNGFLYVD